MIYAIAAAPLVASLPTWVYFIGGLGTFVGCLVGAVAMLRKLGPEVNQIQVTSAQSLVTMAEQNAKMSSQQADRLLRQNKILDDRMTEAFKQLGSAMARIAELEDKAALVDTLRDEVNRLRGELSETRKQKKRTERENHELRERLVHLEHEIERLDATAADEILRMDTTADADRAHQGVVARQAAASADAAHQRIEGVADVDRDTQTAENERVEGHQSEQDTEIDARQMRDQARDLLDQARDVRDEARDEREADRKRKDS